MSFHQGTLIDTYPVCFALYSSFSNGLEKIQRDFSWESVDKGRVFIRLGVRCEIVLRMVLLDVLGIGNLKL